MKFIVESFNDFRVVFREERPDGNVTHYEIPRYWCVRTPVVGEELPSVVHLWSETK